ncbi:MAG TPA: FAD-linked oxidase C-terminal domain-containing protein [bacterium]|nr:FAD-linked oxidase C-terminal domain-containing protein [bacterium]
MADIIKQLQSVLTAEAVLTEPGDLAAYATDAKIKGLPPLVVVLPTETAQVQAIVRLCAQHRLPVIPRGAGTGTVGGAVPEFRALVLDLSRMNRIRTIDRDELLADVQAGVLNADLQREAQQVGLFYPPDPASRATSTLGGNAATNAGGLRAVKYGVTADWVAALEVVTADGQVIHTGVRTRKGVVGYDLTRLFIGSEGTLGIITALTMRLMPLPPAKKTLLGLFATLADAGRAVMAIVRSPIVPAAMELLDSTTLRAVKSRTGDLLPDDIALVLLDVDGSEQEVEQQSAALRELLAAADALEVRVAADEVQADRLWLARRSVSPALYELRPHKYGEDVTVPIHHLVDLFDGVTALATKHRLPHACYGHAGDGNVHVNLLYDPADADEAARAKAARAEVFRLTLALGGTISGEHGVGIAKREFLPWEQSSAMIDLQKRLKRAFDPLGLLNPGKVFP